MRLFTKKAALRKLENVEPELNISQSVLFLFLLLLVETESHIAKVGLELTM